MTEETKHASNSPSGADTWATCTAAPEACKDYKDEPGPDAIAGTEAHALLERCIKNKVHPSISEPDHPAVKGVGVAFDVIAPFLNMKDVIIYSEASVTLNEDCWGTADVVILTPVGELIVMDYKNGFGIVEPDCLQLLIYGAAAYKTYGWLSPKPITEIKTVILQPNSPHPRGPERRHTRTLDEMQQELDAKIMPALADIKSGNTKFVVSDKGCKWCPHGRAGNCDAYNNKGLQKAKAHFNDLSELADPDSDVTGRWTNAQVAEFLEAESLISGVMAACKKRAVNFIKGGGDFPGMKLVKGKSNRVFRKTKEVTDEEGNTETVDVDIVEFLTKTLKLKKSQIYKETLLGPAPIEKLVDPTKRGGKKKQELLQEMIVKPDGKLTLVAKDNPKPAVVFFEELPEGKNTDALQALPTTDASFLN